jgi:hypothetical protein
MATFLTLPGIDLLYERATVFKRGFRLDCIRHHYDSTKRRCWALERGEATIIFWTRFLLSSGAYTTLDDPLSLGENAALGINDAGQIVGSIENGAHGFLYNGGTYITLDDPLASHGTIAFDINDMGHIVGQYTDASNHVDGFLLTITPNPPPPGGTTADMILRAANNSLSAGQYEIYDIGNNSLLSAFQLGVVGTDWQFTTLGGFFGSDTTDMLLRNSKTGGFEVYDINLTNAALLGTVGLDWQAMGFGNFSSRGETDMILRNANNGGVEVYDINKKPAYRRGLHGRGRPELAVFRCRQFQQSR